MGLRNITATRRRLDSVETWTNGKSSESTYTDSTFLCSAQPLTGDEMLSLPEARRGEEGYRIYTDTELKGLTDKNPDKIVIFGSTFEIVLVENWKNGILPHYEATIVRIND